MTRAGKRKGEGNTRNGNKYLAWAFEEASAQLMAITTVLLCQAGILWAFAKLFARRLTR